MKFLIIMLIMGTCLSITGCGSLAHIVQGSYITQPGNGTFDQGITDLSPSSIRVYHNNPYTVHLEIEETDSQEEMQPLNGDGGASLNAYAACLTLKVIF